MLDTAIELVRMRVYYGHGEYIELYTSRLVDVDEIEEIIHRLEVVTAGSKVMLLLFSVLVGVTTSLTQFSDELSSVSLILRTIHPPSSLSSTILISNLQLNS